jgi:hypothetical protein
MPILYETSGSEGEQSVDEWQYEFIPFMPGGLNLEQNPENINSGDLLEAENVRLDKLRVERDFGYASFADAVLGNPRQSYQFYKKDGTVVLVLLTNTTFYIYSSTNNAWELISTATATTVNAVEAAGQTVITVADITGFSDGDLVGIRLDDGTQHITTVNGAPAATEITITDALPSATGVGKAFVLGLSLSGSDSIPVSMTTWAAFDKMYFTNGVDTPQQFDGSTVSDMTGLGGSTFTCQIVQVFNNYLLLMNNTEDGTVYPQRTRWSEPGDPTSWNWAVNFNDLYSRDDRITAAVELGPYNIIYKERSIVRMEYVGHLDKTWDFLPTIPKIGAVSINAVVNLEDHHLVVWEDNIYDYRGGFGIEAIGDKNLCFFGARS